MREIDWADHKAYRAQCVKDTGSWIGLLDQDWVPMMGLPAPVSMRWPRVRGAIDSIEITLPVRTPSGLPHPVVRELVADELGEVDELGRLVPHTGPARLIAVEQAGFQRRVMLITHTVAEGDEHSPHTLTIHGVSLAGYLDLIPCPSNPVSWKGDFTRFDRDWVGDPTTRDLYRQPRDLAPATMIAVADGASVEGDADHVIHRLLKESFDAVHRIAGITTDPVYIAVLAERQGTPQRMIHRPTDETLWKELAARALAANVTVTPQLWWPGDTPVPDHHNLKLPTLIFTVRQEA